MYFICVVQLYVYIALLYILQSYRTVLSPVKPAIVMNLVVYLYKPSIVLKLVLHLNKPTIVLNLYFTCISLRVY